MALARARMFSVLSTARCIAMPTSAISSPTPVAASEILTWASAAEYWALMTSFLVRNCSSLERSFCSLSIRPCCCCSSSATCWSSVCSSVWANCLRSSAVRARSSRPPASAWRAWVSSLTTCCSSFCCCSCRRFLAVTTSAMPFLTFCSSSICFAYEYSSVSDGSSALSSILLIFALMTVDMRPPIPGTATSASWSPWSVPGRGGAAPSELEARGVALHESAPGARNRAPARPGLERLGGGPRLGRARHAGNARVEPEAGDHGVGVAGVGEDRDPRALAPLAPLHERARVERAVEQVAAVEGERDGRRAVDAGGDVELEVVPAAVEVGQVLQRVRGPDGLLDLVRRFGRGGGGAVREQLGLRARDLGAGPEAGRAQGRGRGLLFGCDATRGG